ncbi:T6SS effector BTH_I2691 family protein [Scandinavium sp. M-37]|uniref:T6SS effector BTH_I2691 family protein n=1 Tax=Scandinavium sp. M-37 TaxID=3373077 RepID=UPI003745746E
MMDMKAQTNKNAAASQQAASTPSGCKSCERKGVAIYPLRVAVVPASLVNTGWHPAVPHQDTKLKGGEFKYALRTLREGYVYVLADKQVWYAYQVTPQGFLRMFNANEMPEGGNVEPLSAACLQQNHDIRSSFINIDPKHTHAAVAFSNDPWPRKVLAKYKQAGAPAPRFTQVTIAGGKTATIEGAGRSLTLDPTLSTLTKNVLEFAAEKFPSIVGKEGQPDGAYGFYPRRDIKKQTALGNKVAELQELYGVVHAIVLDDAVGMVQELNHARLDVVDALAKYRSKPANLHQGTISDTILSIQKLMTKQVDADKSIKPVTIPPFTDSPFDQGITFSREDMVAATRRSALERMQEYYSEPNRAKFARDFKAVVDGYQQKLTAVAKDLDAWYHSALWLTVIKQDYSPVTSVISWAAQLNTLAANLQGAMVGMDKDKSAWHDWVESPDSPPFLSLLGKQSGLIAAVYNGSANYTNMKTLLNSQEVCDFVDSINFSQPVSSLTMSMNGAFSMIGEKISAKANAGFERVLQAMAYAAEGEPAVTIFSGEITVREFQNIMLKQLDGHGRPVWGTMRGGTTTTHAGTWLQVTDPAILERKIQVRYASLLKDIESPVYKQAARSSAALSKGSMLKDGSQLSGFPNLILAQDAVDASLATGGMSMTLGDTLRIARQQYQLPRRVFSSSGLGFVLGAVMLGLQKSALDDNLKALKEAVPGDSQAEMKLASSALMVTASAVEMVGFGHMIARWGTNPWDVKPNMIVRGAEIYAHPLIRVAGVIGGVASIVDGFGMYMSAQDAGENGDSTAKNLYLGASFFTISAGGVSIFAGLAGDFALFGPIGICIGLAILGAVLATMAADEVRSPLEVWLSDTCFGLKRGKHEKYWDANSLTDLQAAMKAYYTIASGVSAQIQRERMAEVVLNAAGTGLVAVQVKLSGCSKLGSDWLIELTAKGSGGSQLLAQSASSGKVNNVKTAAKQSFDITPMGMGTTSLSADSVMKERWETSGLLLQGEFAFNRMKFSDVELKVTYWPDKLRPEENLQLTTSA